jgi:hypothetical protein
LWPSGAGLEHDAGEVGTHDVVREVVALAQGRGLAVALEEPERRHRLEDRGPHGVVVDRAGHHRDEGLARAELGEGDVLHVQRLAGVLVAGLEAVEHVDLVLVHGHGPVVVGDLEGGVLLRGRVTGEDGVENLLHGLSPWGRPETVGAGAGHLVVPRMRRESTGQ